MKPNRAILTTAVIMAAAMTAFSQSVNNGTPPVFSPADRYRVKDTLRLEKSYLACLQSENEGVVESSIAQSIWMKLSLPAARFEHAKAVLGSLSVNGRTPAIRYKAYLAGLVFDQPGMFAQEQGRTFETNEQLFTALSERLNALLLTYNDRKYVRPE